MTSSTLAHELRRSIARRPLATAALAAFFVLFTADRLQTAIANGDTRSLSFLHMHTGESLNVTFKRAGRYDETALKQLNWFLRDWRRDESIAMDPHLFDLLWEIHRDVAAKGPVTIVSAYRSPQTNAMLRSRGRGVARQSQHMLGSAIDFYIPDAELADLRAIGLRLQRGGVGFYPSSGSPFIHVDTGGVRHWPRMTREQLARIFPDGKTVHIPADGKPMPGFALAMAEIEARGGRLGPTATAMRDDGGAAQPAADGAPVKRFFASLFGRSDEEADDEAGAARSNRTRLPTATAVASAPAAPAPDQARPPARPMTVASLGPAVPPHAPQLKWTPGPSGVAAGQSAVPLPPSRPGDIGEVTASLPPAITGSDQPATEGRALAYAPADARFGPLPPAHTRLASATEPEPSLTRRLARAPEPAPQVPPALRRTADAAAAPVTMLGGPTLELVTELHHPDLVSLRGLVEPVRAALAVRFDGESIEAPSTARFAGPAVVALQTLAFDRSAGIVTGALVSRATQVR